MTYNLNVCNLHIFPNLGMFPQVETMKTDGLLSNKNNLILLLSH